jgi:multidrug efflux pump subunit AcrA (membrane-fusion protein)
MKQYVTGISALVAVAAILAGTVWFGRPRHQKATLHHTAFPATPMIETSHPIRRNFSASLHWFGKVESKRAVRIVSLAAGKITDVKAANGTFVRQGDLLFTLGGSQVTRTLEALAGEDQ